MQTFQEKSIAIFCNRRAGNGRSIQMLGWIGSKLSERNISFEIFSDNWPHHLEGFTDAWIIGGDGTLNYFINHFPVLKIPLFIFKGGSGNDFAWKLYGNKSIDACFELALSGSPRLVDGGRCNGRYFLNGVGIGFDGAVVKSMGARKWITAGHLAYYLAVIKKLFFFSSPTLKIVSEKLTWYEKSFMVTVANGSRFGGGFLVAPNADVADGYFDVVIIRGISLLKRIKYLPKVQDGKHLDVGVLTRCQKIHVESNSSVPAHVDGELMEANCYDITLLPGRFLFRR